MTGGFPIVPLGRVALPVERPEVPAVGTVYRQIGVKLWGEGAYERGSIDGSQTKYKTLSRVEADDIIVNKIWARNGSVAIVPEGLSGCYASSEFPTFAPIREKLDSRWFHWLTRTKTLWEQCDEKSRGTSGKNRIRPELFLEIGIPLPPLEEQRRIVARIEELAAKIEEARRLRRVAVGEAKVFASSLHLHMAGERFLRLDAFLMLEEIREDVRPGQEYPQVGVKGFGKGLFEKGSVDGSQTTYKAFNRLYYGAVVLSQVKGWEGALAVCCSNLSGRYVSPEYRTFRCVSGLAKPEYLAVIFATPWFWTQLKNMTRGVGARRERIRPEQFLRMEIPMPTIQQQTWAMQLLARLSDLSTLQAATNPELVALLPSILDKAFKGEL